MEIYSGKSVFGGIAIGRISVLSPHTNVTEPIKAENKEKEITRYISAVNLAKNQLTELYNAAVERVGTKSAEIFEIHKMMLEDSDYSNNIKKLINDESVNAEYAVYKTGNEFASVFSEMDNEYMRERSADVKDISQRVISNLCGNSDNIHNLSVPSIIIAEDLTPSQTIQFDRNNILAFVTSKGSATSHTSILAGVMNIPAIVNADIPIDASLEGHIAAIDAYSGKIYLDPDNALLTPLKKRLQEDKDRQSALDAYRGKETLTSLGKKINLFSNIGSPNDVKYVIENDSEGVGLFRSEFLYIGKSAPPSEELQFEAYKSVAQQLGNKPVIIRTFDIGADKKADFINMDNEENPALGVRGIRLNLKERELFTTQLRAIYRASAYGNLSIMYPMIISVEELLEAKKISALVRNQLSSENIMFKNVPEGIMIETPAAALISDELAKVCDFFSIGTNDLTQYTLAVDRQNSFLDSTYNPLHPSIFSLIKTICENAHANNIWAGVCGELGGNKDAVAKLISCGVDELSVSPNKTLPIRKIISDCKEYVPDLLR